MQLVTFGEAMLRLTPRDKSFDVYVGGAELNVAVAAAKLGVGARWVSRLPENPAGRMIADRARDEGVDVSCISWTTEGRAGIYYVEVGDEPGRTRVTYDRAGSAMALVAPGMVDWTRALEGARWFHVSGITPALSESAAATMHEALGAAKHAGLTISYDLNYRPALWTPGRARDVQRSLLCSADVLICSEDGARLVFGRSDDAEGLARALQAQFEIPTVAITIRDSKRTRNACWSALVLDEGRAHHAPSVECEVVEPVGAGDAFSAGLIYGRLEGEPWDVAARCGVALAAIKHGTPGDFSQATSIADR
ncbi:MAG TPA: sugar kinase [Gemmatimonadaceae bacterium]